MNLKDFQTSFTHSVSERGKGCANEPTAATVNKRLDFGDDFPSSASSSSSSGFAGAAATAATAAATDEARTSTEHEPFTINWIDSKAMFGGPHVHGVENLPQLRGEY